jgi:hypothetical protein
MPKLNTRALRVGVAYTQRRKAASMPNEPLTELPAWVLEEPVDITLIYDNPDTATGIYLVQKTDGREYVALTFMEGLIELNGRPIDLGERLMDVCSMIDEANDKMSVRYADGNPIAQLGVTVRSEPFRS